jgi:hypothetical protein
MIITRETKERFVEMLEKKEIIVVGRKIKTNYDFKFIGVHNGMKWDFTPTVAYCTGWRTNGVYDITHMTVRSYSADYLVEQTLKNMPNDCVKVPKNLLDNVSDYLAYFWM